MAEKIEKVSKVDKALKKFQNTLEQPLASGEATNKEYFDRLMGQDPSKKVQPEEQDVAKQRYEKKAPSLLDEVADVNRKLERFGYVIANDIFFRRGYRDQLRELTRGRFIYLFKGIRQMKNLGNKRKLALPAYHFVSDRVAMNRRLDRLADIE